MASVQKICVGCNTDVANKKRVKDTEGNYYCQSCFEAKRSVKKAAEPVAAAASANKSGNAAAADPYAFPPEPLDIGEIGFAEEPQQLAPEPMAADMFGCADCKKLVNSKQIRNDDGDFVCSACFAKRRIPRGTGKATPKATSGKPGAAKFSSFGEDEVAPPTFYDSTLAGLVFTPGIFIATFALILGINFVMPTFKGTGVSLILAVGYTAMAVVTAGLLLVSLLIAKLTGAVTLDRFGGKLWKMCALSAGLTLIIRVVDHLEIAWSIPFVWLITSIMRYYILRGGIGVIFNIDVSAARVVAIINTLIGWGLRIVLYVVMFIAIAAAHIHNHEDDDGRPVKDEPNPFHLNLRNLPANNNADAPADPNAAPADNNAAPADNNAQPAAPQPAAPGN